MGIIKDFVSAILIPRKALFEIRLKHYYNLIIDKQTYDFKRQMNTHKANEF